MWFSKSGADVDAIDISPKSIENQKIIAELLRLNISCFVMDANNLDFPDDEYDIVYGNAILHHLDVKECCEEIYRDVMDGNAFLKLFRLATPFWRTEDEHPLTKNDFAFFKQRFSDCNNTQFILSGLPYFFFVRIMNNVILKKLKIKLKIPLNNSIYSFFDKVDDFLFWLFPFTKSRAWLCLVELQK